MASPEKLKAAILIISDTASTDPSTDRAIPVLESVFSEAGNGQWDIAETKIVADDALAIQRAITLWSDGGDESVNLVVTSGGTGFAVKDRTPEVS
jgi:gephyrin